MKRPWTKTTPTRDPIPVYDTDGKTLKGHLDPNNDYLFTPAPGVTESTKQAAMRLLRTRVWGGHYPAAARALMRERPGLSYGEASSAISLALRDMDTGRETRPELVAILKHFSPAQVMQYADECRALTAKGVHELEARRRVLLRDR